MRVTLNMESDERSVERAREQRDSVDGTVLIADEDVNARIIAETLLRACGVHVRVAIDGPDARDIISRDRPEVVVLDMALSGMNGLELIRWMRGRLDVLAPPTQPRIVAISERTDPDIERFALRLGADAFLRKPMDPSQFIKTVEQLLAMPARMRVATAS